MSKTLGFFLLTTLLFTLACRDFQREIEIDLPEYTPEYVVEAYLEPGEPFRLLLTKSDAFFAPFQLDNEQFIENLLVAEADVIIRHDGKETVIPNRAEFDFQTGKLYNYTTTFETDTVPENYTDPFELEIRTQDGTTLTATTTLLRPVPIDSIVVEFDGNAPEDTLARALLYFSDDTGTDNWYRRQLHEVALDSIAEQDFVTPDEIVGGDGTVVFGTGFDFAEGDTVINTLYHLDRAYYDFLLSVDNAESSNGNPFGTPGVILGNVEGGIGIFTGLSYDRVMTIVER